ncbi:MAG: aldo/keto reductase [Gammaproteobacteria bacterium]|nr:aldo/keto reductase [Gammaproteobacteria bacterium]
MSIEKKELRPGFTIPRLLKGNWQIAEDHSDRRFDEIELMEDLVAFAEAGMNTYVCGDIYAGVEEKLGKFRQFYRERAGDEAARQIKVFTTYVPYFLEEEKLRNHSFKDVEKIVDRSLQRLGQERLDLVQMHWWEFSIPGHIDMALDLQKLQQAGKIDKLAVTNYDVQQTKELLDAGIDIVSNTVQYSLTDRRPENGMVDLCAQHDMKLLCYGALGGGLFSDKWIGIPDPGKPAFENVSLDKYYRIVNDFGGWNLFQELLQILEEIAEKHSVSIGNVAVRYILERDQVAAVIIGARHAKHLVENLRTQTFSLDENDYQKLDGVLSRSTGPAGDIYSVDREENRDALEEPKTEYFDVEEGKLVKKTREEVTVSEPYGHHLKT